MFYVITDLDKDLLRPVSGATRLAFSQFGNIAQGIWCHITGASRHLDGFHIACRTCMVA
jgi:hypothetical protein